MKKITLFALLFALLLSACTKADGVPDSSELAPLLAGESPLSAGQELSGSPSPEGSESAIPVSGGGEEGTAENPIPIEPSATEQAAATVEPTVIPTVEATAAPTAEPTVIPTPEATAAPTTEPTPPPTVPPEPSPAVTPSPPPQSPVPTQAPPPLSTSEATQSGTLIDIGFAPLDITAKNVYAFNASSGTVYLEKDCDAKVAPASTVKILTALTALDYLAPGDALTVGEEINMIASDSSRAWLNVGDKLTTKQLLVAMLLPSGNDAAYSLAVCAGRKMAGDQSITAQKAIELFTGAMNQKAEDCGALSSHFATPDGYDAEGQYTTARDLAQIAKACLENDTLREITGQYKISDKWLNGREVTYRNTNELLNPGSQYYYKKAIGLKTGTTSTAGYCLVSAAEISGDTFICVILGSASGVRFTDSLHVFNAIDGTVTPS